ncbi:PA1571 family protein [uncultured Acinetobacter sp.]|uniref:PA1571 family protein n=1 Tax=uncultured Acinetobacter sp. TaxID=165433 RepID=UPI003456295B
MGVTKIMMSASVQHQPSAQKTTHHAYMVDEQGKEVQITTAMVRSVCHQLLQQCRMIKH